MDTFESGGEFHVDMMRKKNASASMNYSSKIIGMFSSIYGFLKIKIQNLYMQFFKT